MDNGDNDGPDPYQWREAAQQKVDRDAEEGKKAEEADLMFMLGGVALIAGSLIIAITAFLNGWRPSG